MWDLTQGVVLLAAASAFLALRLWPVWPQRNRGCDAFNILLNAECLRASRRLPIRIPGLFLLENDEQWYPPGFLVFCAVLPPGWLARRYWLVNHLVDLISALGLFVAAQAAGVGAVLSGAAMLVYAICAAAITELAVLNTRAFGLLLFNAVLLCGYAASIDPRWMALCVPLGVLLVFSHKLSAQQLWVTLPALSAATGQWLWVALLLASYLGALLVWPRGAWRVLVGHWRIVRFWQRNWPTLGAHAVRQSPVYGDGRTRSDVYADESFAAALRFLKDALHQNYLLLPVAAGLLVAGGARSPLELFTLVWIGSAYALGLCVHFVKPLRGIGLGRQYFKFSVLPALLYTAVQLEGHPNVTMSACAVLAALLAVRHYLQVGIGVRHAAQPSPAEDHALEQVLGELANDADARVLALPVHLCDLIAHRIRRPVYWGTHSDVFDERLEAFFPVLRHPLGHYAADGANRLLLDSRYAGAEELGLDADSALCRSGPYLLFALERA